MEAGPVSDKEPLFVPVQSGLLFDLLSANERRDPTSFDLGTGPVAPVALAEV